MGTDRGETAPSAGRPRRRHSSQFKAQVALEALKGQKTLNELASECGVHPVQIAQWKRQLLDASAASSTAARAGAVSASRSTLVEQLYQEIGQLKVEVDWLRKKGQFPLVNEAGTDRADASAAQHRATVRLCWGWRAPVGTTSRRGDGGEPGADAAAGRAVHQDAVLRRRAHDGLAAAAGLRGQSQAGAPAAAAHGAGSALPQAAPEPARTPGTAEKRYPYLLRGRTITAVNEVWSTDITYIRMRQGFLYLVAVLDWYSRYVLGLGTLQHARYQLLSGGAGGRVAAGPAADLQHRSGRPVHQRRLHRAAGTGGHSDQLGWAGTGAGQHLRRALVALGQMGGGVPARLPDGRWTPTTASTAISASTTTNGHIRRWAIRHLLRSMAWPRNPCYTACSINAN